MSYGLKDRATPEDIRALLEVVTRDEPAAAHGFGTVATMLTAVDERFPRVVLRCAFAACIRPNRGWGISDETVAARIDHVRERVKSALDAELAWLANERPEPDWPVFPEDAPSPRRGFRVLGGRVQRDEPGQPRSRPDEYVDHQAAAVWLSQCSSLVDVVKRPWLREMVRAYARWTAVANGAGLDKDDEVDRQPMEWNNFYFDLLAQCLSWLAFPEIEQLALAPMSSFPERPFFDVLPQFLRSIDVVYFNDRGLEESIAISIRSALANRLMASSGWKRLRGSRSASIESHIGPAIAVLFFNDHGFARQPKCYLPTASIDRLVPFLPVLEQLIESGPSYFVAVVTLNLLEVSPRQAHLHFIVTATKAWMHSYPNDTEFWVDYGIGRRVCVWIEEVRRQEPTLLDTNEEVRFDVDRLLAALISLGVADARRLEETLARVSESGA